MDKKTTDIVAYLTWIGFIIALVAGDKENSKFHLNQALVLNLFALIGSFSWIPIIGILTGIWSLFVFVCWIIGFVAAINGEEKEVPLLGKIKILK
ncbi:MAG: hypothetical protein MRZ39_01205 [Oscillospiraceae bacterium]|nr:hypothetical protein [Oscillospiraceae bacterium]